MSRRDVLETIAATLVSLVGVVILLLVAGCAHAPTSPAAVNAGCDSACTTPCVGADGDVGIRWDGTPTDATAWDDLAGTVLPDLVDKLRVCDLSRSSCVSCLDNLRKKGIIQ